MLNHAQIEWLKIARDLKAGFVAEDRRSLFVLERMNCLDRTGVTRLPWQMSRWRITGHGLQMLDKALEEAAPVAPVASPELGKRERDLLRVAREAGRCPGFSSHVRKATLRRLVALGLIEENTDMPVSRWWRITDRGEAVAESYGL